MINQKGTASLIIVVFLAILISSLTTSINIGYLTTQRADLQKLVDQAALAAVQEIDQTSYYQHGLSRGLTLDKRESQKTALEFISKNSKFKNNVSTQVMVVNDEITLVSEVNIGLPIAPAVINFPVRASASAQLIPGF